MASFLKLPRELRDRVYSHVTELASHTPPQSYSGFYVSCKQIKQEIDEETRKPLRWLRNHTQRPHAEFSVTSFTNQRNVRFAMPKILASAGLNSKSVFKLRNPHLAPRIWLHDITLRYRSWDDAPTRLNPGSARACIDFLKELDTLPISAQRIVLEIPTTDGSLDALLRDDRGDSIIFRKIGNFWEVKTVPAGTAGEHEYLEITIFKLHGFGEDG